MRRFLTTMIVFGTVSIAPALAMAAPDAQDARYSAVGRHHAHGPVPIYSVTARPASATVQVGHRTAMTVTIKNNTKRPQPGWLTVHWQGARAAQGARGTRGARSAGRLAVSAVRSCALDRKSATLTCSFSARPGATTMFRFGVRGTAPGVMNAAFTATPGRMGTAHRVGRARQAASAAQATTSARLRVVRRAPEGRPAEGVLVRLAGPSHASPGQTVRYTATVINTGQMPARGVRLQAVFPRGLAHLTLNQKARKTTACTIAGRVATCTFRRIATGERTAMTVRANVTAPVWRHAALASTARTTARTTARPAAKPRAQAHRAQADAVSAVRLNATARRSHGSARQAQARQHLTVTARIIRVICYYGPIKPNHVPGTLAVFTTVMQPTAPAAMPGAALSRAPRLPATGAPILP